MKTRILMMLLFFTQVCFSQDTIVRPVDSLQTRFFSFTPRYKKVDKVNGLAFGIGVNFTEECSIKKINGLNIEASPLSALVLLFGDPERAGFRDKPTFVHNGLNISSGNFNHSKLNGVGISAFNVGYACNGVSVSVIYNYSTKLNGLHISGVGNVSKNANGVMVSVFNDSEIMNGLQIGCSNKSKKFKGVQIGLLNKTKTQKGLQIGFWNINDKRSMPFLNW